MEIKWRPNDLRAKIFNLYKKHIRFKIFLLQTVFNDYAIIYKC